ncbi:MAG TPA: tetratricopeptide repeat protein [Thiobacillaceae bacterium]|nr:tetratricopeptide repeat protein [Thiobacillaceae bacterium]HNI08235.1 tetratricopeptide repeat protein [Thiobacillaceae bacterium]
MPAGAEQPVSPAAGATIPELDLSPQEELVVRGRDTANWVLSYSAVMPLEPPAGADWAADAREAVGRGALAETILILDGVPPEKQDAPWRIYRANVLLRIGLLDEAEATLGPALGGDKAWPAAQALDSVLASIRGQPDKADAQARQAIQGDPRSAVAWLALSYTQQAQGRLSEALESTLRAQSADPGHATGWTREAELNMALGRREAARRAADHALAMQPGSAIGHGVRALVALLESDWPAAKSGFSNAVRLNPSDANARFGLALVHIQAGDLPRARDELEIAIGRAPGNALFHAYLGRVYLGLGDRDKAWLLLERAKELDPNNPATWLFAGQLRLEENQPASALEEIRGSIDRNEGRKVYRESTLLNEDQALNQIDLSRAQEALGFLEPALWAAQTATRESGPGNVAARNLADLYAQASRGLPARRSLALQSLFDAPLGQLPLALDVAQGVGGTANIPNHGLPVAMEPRPAGLNEYSGIFARQGWQMAVEANGGSFDTWGGQARLGGVLGELGVGLAGLGQKSDGIDGRALDNKVLQALLQARLAQDISTFLEYRRVDSRREEVFFPYDLFVTPIQDDEIVNIGRLGLNWRLGEQSSLRLLLARQWRDLVANYTSAGFGAAFPGTANMPELQYLGNWGKLALTLGASRYDESGRVELPVGSLLYFSDIRADLAYAYGTWRPRQDLNLTLGISHVHYSQDGGSIEYSRTMPKLGINWRPTTGSELRFAVLEAAALPKTGGAGLEPVDVAGTPQWFGDEIGGVYRRASLGWRQALSPSLDLMLEWDNDRIQVPGVFGGGDVFDPAYERTLKAGLYWRLPHTWLQPWQGGLRLTLDRLDHDDHDAVLDNAQLRQQIARHWTLGGRFAGPGGLGLNLALTRVDAKQTFATSTPLPLTDAEGFWIVDLAASWNFDRNRKRFSLGVRNAADQSIGRYQEIDPLMPRFAPNRFFYTRLQWQLD